MDSTSSYRPTSYSARNYATVKEDEDLQLAMKLSLEENRHANVGYRPGYSAHPPSHSSQEPSRPPTVPSAAAEEDDPDLAAAIAASLREMALPQPSAPGERTSSLVTSNSSYTQTSQPQVQAPLPVDLPPRDADALLTFAQATVTARQTGQPMHEVTPLYESATASRPMMVKSVQDTSRRHREFRHLLVFHLANLI